MRPASPDSGSTPHALQQRAKALLPILRGQARRPYIVELAGTPKAGKTTALHVLRRFFKQCGYHVEVMRERAEDCPIAMKGHFFFNTWTTTTMIASMIEKLDTQADLLLLDRGVFDSLVWLEDQSNAHQVSPQERQVFRNFALLDRWRALTDLTCILTVSPEVAMRRENAGQLLPRSGSIVSDDFLARYNRVLGDVRTELSDQFHFVDLDTSAFDSPMPVNEALADALLDNMRHWVDPEIAAIPRSVAQELFAERPVLPLPEAAELLERAMVFETRSVLEADDGYVQLVSAAVLRHGEKIVVQRRSSKHDPKRKDFGRDVLFKSCHIARPSGEQPLLPNAAAAIMARLKEDFHIATLDSEPVPQAVVWNDDPKLARHLGIMFDLQIPSAKFAESLTGKVFKRERNRTRLQLPELASPAALYARAQSGQELQLEPWSKDLLEHLRSTEAEAVR